MAEGIKKVFGELDSKANEELQRLNGLKISYTNLINVTSQILTQVKNLEEAWWTNSMAKLDIPEEFKGKLIYENGVIYTMLPPVVEAVPVEKEEVVKEPVKDGKSKK